MKQAFLITSFEACKQIEDDMLLEMEYLDKHFDDFSISELFYAMQMIDGEAHAINNYMRDVLKCHKYYKEGPMTRTVESWYKKKGQLENRIMDMRISLA